MVKSREMRLLSRPIGAPTRDNFELATVAIPEPAIGEAQVRNLWMAVDPAMRGRMSDAKSYISPFVLGKAMEGPAIGVVTQSNDLSLQPGDIVWSRMGWREVFNAPAHTLKKRDCSVLPAQSYLGFAGNTGLTAYVGFFEVASPRPRDIVFVSAASGGVGACVCQMAKVTGHTVIGAAGGPRKIAYLRDELKLDAAIDYKAEPSLTKALARVAPQGIDIYFDNVGGEHLQAALAVANRFAHFALCGMISVYNATEPAAAPRNLMQAVVKSIRMQGFIASHYAHFEEQFLRDVTAWYSEGSLNLAETVYEGIDKSLDALFGLFTGENLGRMLVKLS
jgi:NADPH-dependent curcumin reductase CurA